jgi:2-dehydropantoate 2-reductase
MVASTQQGDRVLIVGAGGIGGVVAGSLLDANAGLLSDVVCLTTNATIAEAIRQRGIELRGVDGNRRVPAKVVSELNSEMPKFDWILLATQPPTVEEAARQALPWLAPDGHMVCFQNGLCEERIEKIVGVGRVIGAVVAWGAAMLEPGVYERTSAGGFALGKMNGVQDPALERLAILLETIGPVNLTSNLAGARWSKLAINCAISTLGTLGGNRLGALMIHRVVRRLALEIMTEVVEVALAERIALEKVAGTIDLQWIALNDEEKTAVGSAGLLAKHSMLLAVGARYRRMRSSMLSAIERGRPPAVDFLNGEVVTRGKKYGISTPVNSEAQALVHALARKEFDPGMETIRLLATRTRRG